MPLKEKILFTSVDEEFLEHLNAPSNNRILFSAPFGSGKTTFLIDFFEKQEHLKSIHLYPVNYAVAGNDDIFELIKYDIFYELLGKHRDDLKLVNEEFSMLLTSQSFLMNDVDLINIIKSIVKNTSKIGKASVEIIDVLKDQINKYVKYHEDQQIDEFDRIKRYLEAFELKAGIHEFDEFSRLIAELLQRLKGEEKLQKTVLVIDDLDRIDPEHIFRLFNVFSAHYNPIRNENKFGFDHVIFVCDIENIRKIYEHKYGLGVDFTGYINKFYSKGAFTFNNKRQLSEKLKMIIASVSPLTAGLINPNDPILKYNLSHSDKGFTISITLILKALLAADLLDLRSLINMDKFRIKDYTFYDDIHKGLYSHSVNFEFLILVQFFQQLFGSVSAFEEKLSKLSNLKSSNPKYLQFEEGYYQDNWGNWIISYCLPFLVNASASSETNIFKYEGYNIHYSVEKRFYDYRYDFLKITHALDEKLLTLNEVNLFRIMNITFEEIKRNNILQ